MTTNQPKALTLDSFPPELLRTIVQYLALSDLKSIRQTSKLWASVGAEYLLGPVFTLLFHRDDLTRLKNVSTHPSLRCGIKTIKFNWAALDHYQALHNMYFLHYIRSSGVRQTLLSDAWAACKTIKEDKDSNAMKNQYDSRALQSVLASFDSLQRIEITFHDCPFENKTLQRMWKFPSSRQRTGPDGLANLIKVLRACEGLELKSFRHDRMPMQFFSFPEYMCHAFDIPRHVTELEIGLGWTQAQDEDGAMQNLGTWMSSAPKLKTLRLSAAFNPFLDLLTLPTLEAFALDQVNIYAITLLNFLLRHKDTLRYLELGSEVSLYRIEDSNDPKTWRDVLRNVGEEMKLEKVRVLVTKPAANRATREAMLSSDDPWNVYEDDGVQALEDFCLRGGRWPAELELEGEFKSIAAESTEQFGGTTDEHWEDEFLSEQDADADAHDEDYVTHEDLFYVTHDDLFYVFEDLDQPHASIAADSS
jgi:hypothetical protein